MKRRSVIPLVLPVLPVVKVTLREFDAIQDGHPSKKLEKILVPLEGRCIRYEITDLPDRTPPKTDLYFMLHGDFVKIGQSAEPYKRLLEFQTGAPEILKILAVIPEKGEVEKYCHKKLKHLHHRGEWFKYTKETDDLIKEIAGAIGIPIS